MAPKTVLDWALRLSNVIVAVLGLTLLSLGIYMTVNNKNPLSIVSDAAMGLGCIDIFFGLLLFFGFRSLFLIRLYALVIGLLEIVQIVIVILFEIPSFRGRLLEQVNPGLSENDKDRLNKNIDTVGWVLLSVVAFQAVVLVLVLLQSCALDKPFDESVYEEEAGQARTLLGTGGGGKDRFGALADEGAVTASDRYREKHGSYYSKYGIK